MVAIDHFGHGEARRAVPRAGRAVSLMFAGVLAAAGVLRLGALPWSETATAVSAAFWPKAAAQVIAASLTEVAVPGVAGLATELRLSVIYEYEVDGRRFEGRTASLADEGRADDRRLIALYRKAEFAHITGRSLTVSYDPNGPETAFIEARVPWHRLLTGLGTGLGLLIAANWFLARRPETPAGARIGREGRPR